MGRCHHGQPSLFVGRNHGWDGSGSLFEEATTVRKGCTRWAIRVVASHASLRGPLRARSQGPGQPLTVAQGRSIPISGRACHMRGRRPLRTRLSLPPARTSSSDVRPSPLVPWPALGGSEPADRRGTEEQSSDWRSSRACSPHARGERRAMWCGTGRPAVGRSVDGDLRQPGAQPGARAHPSAARPAHVRSAEDPLVQETPGGDRATPVVGGSPSHHWTSRRSRPPLSRDLGRR